jgi:hypothetical protein
MEHGGKPASISKTARLTGLSRAEVKRLMEDPSTDNLPAIATCYPEGIALHFWHSDPGYLDASGDPRQIEFEGGAGSFCDLVARHVEGQEPSALLHRLRRGGCVVTQEDGTLKAVKRNFSDPDALAMALTSMETMAQTIAHNNLNKHEPTIIQRTVYSHTIDPSDLVKVRRLLRAKAVNFCEEVDDLFAGHEVVDPTSPEEAAEASLMTAGLGVYYYEKPTA